LKTNHARKPEWDKVNPLLIYSEPIKTSHILWCFAYNLAEFANRQPDFFSFSLTLYVHFKIFRNEAVQIVFKSDSYQYNCHKICTCRGTNLFSIWK